MFRLVIYRRQRARFPRPVAPSAGASHTHTASYNYSHSHRLEHLRFLRGSPRDLSSLRTQHGNTAGYVRGKQVARMTSLFPHPPPYSIPFTIRMFTPVGEWPQRLRGASQALGLVGAPGRARGGRSPNLATSTWLPNKVPSAGRLPYLVTCLLSRRLGLIYSYSSPVQRAQPTADPLCGASILAHGGSLRPARARIRE